MIKYIDMLRDIYRFETATGVEDEKKSVKYIPELKMYQSILSNDMVKQRYYEVKAKLDEVEHGTEDGDIKAREETKPDEVQKHERTLEPAAQYIQVVKELSLKESRIFVEKRTETSCDKATFSYKNSKNAIRSYCRINGSKAMGYIYNEKHYYLMHRPSGDGGDGLSQKIEPEEDAVGYFQNYYESLCGQINEYEKDEQKKLADAAAAERRAAERRINPVFQKRLRKIEKRERVKCIRRKDFDAFDFRDTDISNMIFVECSFDNANFTDLKILDTLFVKCSFEGTNETGTIYERCEKIECT